MTPHSGAGDGTLFLDMHIAACFDAAVPRLVDLVIDETDIGAALRALAGLGFTDRFELVIATEALHLAWWFLRLQKALEERTGRRRCWSGSQQRFRGLLGWWQIQFPIFADLRKTGDWLIARKALAVHDAEIATTVSTLGGNYQCRFLLFVSTFRTSHLDAMAHGLIGHGDK